jgi:hypothetical protein
MNDKGLFVGRHKELAQLRKAYSNRCRVLITGPAGVGKSALLRQARLYVSLLLCEETSSLRRICETLEQQLGWTHRKVNVVERKNRLLPYLLCRAQLVAFDGVASAPPRVARFIAHVSECISVWITCRSADPKQIGAVWEYLYQFEHMELGPLSPKETRVLLEAAINAGRLARLPRNHYSQLHRLSKGNPRVLEELLIELASRDYRLEDPFGRRLLDLDRRIHNFTAIARTGSG